MKPLTFTSLFLLCLSGAFGQSAPPFVTYAGQVASGGQPYNGTGQFKFAFVNADANVTYWSHDGTSSAGSEPGGFVSVQVNGGYYSVLLGNTAISGMAAIDPAIFKTYADVHLRVWFSDGVAAFEEMTPHRPFASVPYALNAGVSPGSISKSMLASDVLGDLNRTIDKSMLAPEVLNDLNATPSTGSITKSMLSYEVLTDLNRTQSVVGTSDDAFTEGLRAYLRPMLAGGVWHSWGLEGMPVTLKAPKVDGRFLTYQWYKGGSPISGATGTEYIIPDFNATRDAGDYEIRVSNAFATLKTKAVLQTGTTYSLAILKHWEQESSLFIKSNGGIYGSGGNIGGVLGFGHGGGYHYMYPERALSSDGSLSVGFTHVESGYDKINFLKNDGSVHSTGHGRSNYLELDSNLTGAIQFSSGEGFTMFIKGNGSLWGVGRNTYGQLGDGGTTDRSSPVQVPGVGNVIDVSAGGICTMFVKSDGTIWGMGDNRQGQLGDGTTQNKTSPVQVAGITNAEKVEVGIYNYWNAADGLNTSTHTVFLKSDGTLWGMGDNGQGQLGDGTTQNRTTPVQMGSASNVVEFAAGHQFTMYIKNDGTLWGVGNNEWGQLGDSSTTNRTSPVQVAGVTNAVKVKAGLTYTIFVKADGSIWAMGSNSFGTFGNGQNGSSTIPIEVGSMIAMEEQPFAPESLYDITQSERPSSERSTHVVQSAANLEMLWVEPGTFTMGSPTGETGRSSSETEHNVTLTKGFYLGKYEVTQAQYAAVMSGNSNSLNPSPSNWPNNPNRPVEKVSWNDVQIFLTRLNSAEQTAGRLPAGWSYVLPTESQWEYACRAGTTTAYSWGATIASSDANWNHGSDANQTENVGQYAANPWGFFDMHGNVWEWTADRSGNYPTGNPVIDPTGPASGSSRVGRGGSWFNDGTPLRSAERNFTSPSSRSFSIGFRVGFQQQ